jgi:hypothetical protein
MFFWQSCACFYYIQCLLLWEWNLLSISHNLVSLQTCVCLFYFYFDALCVRHQFCHINFSSAWKNSNQESRNAHLPFLLCVHVSDTLVLSIILPSAWQHSNQEYLSKKKNIPTRNQGMGIYPSFFLIPIVSIIQDRLILFTVCINILLKTYLHNLMMSPLWKP